MDPSTVIIVLAINLLCSGGLYFLIARGMPPRSGLATWGAGCVVFGVAYLGRLSAGLENAPGWIGAMDVAMAIAALLFLSGLREFVGRAPLRWQAIAVAALVYAGAHVVAFRLWGLTGRHLLQNMVLGTIYLMLAHEAWRARAHQSAALHPPLRVLTALVGGLALMTAVRSAAVLIHGTEVLYRGVLAQVYYGYAVFAALLLELSLVWMVFVRLNGQLADLATRDALTRVFNRNGLDEQLQRHFAARAPQPLTLLQVDVDHFKSINDAHGHAAGDRVLRAVADVLVAKVRGSDFVARVGGEEFLVGCVGADDAVPRALAERLRAGVAALRVPLEGREEPLRCTVSIGVSRRCATSAGCAAAWREADQALYAAKAAGRDRVEAFAG